MTMAIKTIEIKPDMAKQFALTLGIAVLANVIVRLIFPSATTVQEEEQ